MMAAPGAVEKRLPVFTTVDQLRPDTSGHNLVVKVTAPSRARFPPAHLGLSAAPTRAAHRRCSAIVDVHWVMVASGSRRGCRAVTCPRFLQKEHE